jgi:hypothetical protein
MPDLHEPPAAAHASAGERPMWQIPEHTGEYYGEVLRRFHELFKPETYLEIGVNTGDTFDLASCAAIAIDPNFQLQRPMVNRKPSACFFNMTSDAFFKKHDPTAIFGQPIDMAFLDGMHWFEFLLRDFINTEKHCKTNSIVLLHDCMPTDEHVARRDPGDARFVGQTRNEGWWAGDVWKVTAILLKYRPNLKILPFDASPTGLVAITGLDPQSTFLAENYFDIVSEYAAMGIGSHGDDYLASLRPVACGSYNAYQSLSSLFWL